MANGDVHGNVEALIGIESGLVYRLVLMTSEPLMEMTYSTEHRAQMQRAMNAQLAKMPPGKSRDQLQRQHNRQSNPAMTFLGEGWP